MIAEAQIEDLTDSLELAQEFHQALGLPGDFDGGIWKSQWQELIESGKGYIAKRYSHGQLKEAIGIEYAEDTNTQLVNGIVKFWYVRGGNAALASGMLMSQVLDKLKKEGVYSVALTVWINEDYEGVFNCLAKRGFVPVETIMRKVL